MRHTIISIGEILFDIYPGGKKIGGAPFNFMYHINQLTGGSYIVSRIGQDELGKEIFDFFKENQITTEFIQSDNSLLTGIAIPKLNRKKVPEWYIEENRAYDRIELNNKLTSLVEKSNCLYFGTLAQRNEYSRKTITSLFQKNDVKYFCDLNIRQNHYSIPVLETSLQNANVVKLNEQEFELVIKLFYESKTNEDEIVKSIIQDYKLDILCITKGEKGAVIHNGSNKSSFKCTPSCVVDTVGAGDAYSSILCLGYLRNWDIHKINKIASEFAAEIVKIKGALPEDNSFYEKYKELFQNE
jgi:fructokinase